ncbi:MAG: hypothetical protein NVS9B15_13600 [Acidobacteriaceae bacterium]
MRKMKATLLLLAAMLTLVAGCRRHHDNDDDDNGHQKRIALPAPKGTAKRPVGSPALKTPITKAEVVAYFKTHNLPMNLGKTSDITVANVEFLNNAQVVQRLNGANPGLADGDKLAFATLRGTFIFTGPPKSRVVRFNSAYAVFDVSSGNLLMIGTLDGGGSDGQPR